MSSSLYHLPNLTHQQDNNNSSLPVTPKSSNNNNNNAAGSAATTPKTAYRYEPYKNFARVFLSASTPSTSRANSRSTTPRNNNNQNQEDESASYCYHNVSKKKNNNSDVQEDCGHNHPCFELEVISGTNTPTARMETEQNFPHHHHQHQQQQNQETNNNHNNSSSSTPISNQQSEDNNNDNNNHHNIMLMSSSSSSSDQMSLPKPRSQQQSSNDDNDNTNNQDTTTVEPMRAAVRTMQHLLQNVPYLFLDIVAESTVLCRAQHHKVGQHIVPWAGSPVSAMHPDDQRRYSSQAVRDVFVAQLPFDLPLEAIQLVADLLIEGPRVHILHAAPHIKAHRSYDGCCFVKMFEDDANRFIAAMHKRVLFDVDGVWVATTLPELQELTDYCAWFQEQKTEQRKEILKMPTPFSAMTAEFALRGSRGGNGNNANNTNTHSYYQRPSPAYQQYNNINTNNSTVVDQNPHQRHLAQLLNGNNQQQQQQRQNTFNNNYQNGGYYQNTFYSPSCNTNYYGGY